MKGLIIGGGIAGLTAAIALKKAGHEVEVYESAPSFKPVGAGLLLAGNAIKAYEYLGISDEILAAGHFMPQLLLKDKLGRILSFVDSKTIKVKFGVDNFAVHRADLHAVLTRHVQADFIHNNKTAISHAINGEKVVVQFKDGTSATGDYLIAADGIHSAIRAKLIPEVKPRYSGYTCWRSIVPQLSTPVVFPSETWGPGRRFGIVPLKNNKIYWYATLNAPQNDQKLKNYKSKDLQKILGGFHDPIQEILVITNNKQLIWNDIIDLKPQKKFAFDRILLIGDAAHATTPNMGQGACMAIEDAVTLLPLFGKFGDDVNRAC